MCKYVFGLGLGSICLVLFCKECTTCTSWPIHSIGSFDAENVNSCCTALKEKWRVHLLRWKDVLFAVDNQNCLSPCVLVSPFLWTKLSGEVIKVFSGNLWLTFKGIARNRQFYYGSFSGFASFIKKKRKQDMEGISS